MKKALIILVAMLFLVVAVGAAYAGETTFNGQYKIRAWTSWNFDKRPNELNSEKGLYTGYFDQRFRLTITHKSSEYLKAVVQFDLVEDTWGQQRNFRINNSTSGAFVRKAYIEFNVPKVGTFTVGKQPQYLGYGLILSDSLGKLDGLKWANKWGPVGVSAMYFKWNDNVSLPTTGEIYNRDTDIWALDLKITPSNKQLIELYGGYVNYRTGMPISHKLGHNGLMGPTETIHSNVGFAGLAYTGEFADMLTVKAELSGVFGRADLRNWGGAFAGVDDAFVGGYNIYLDAAYHNDMLKVGLAFVLGSGDTSDRVREHRYNANFICNPGDFAFGNIVGGGVAGGGVNDKWNSGLGFANDIENLTAVKLYFEVTPMEKLTLNAAVIWAKWTEPVGFNATTADSAYHHPVHYYGNTIYNSWEKSTDLGWEIDLGAKYEIMQGLTYTVQGGVLFTGDSFDYEKIGAPTIRQEWGPIWTVRNELTYEF